MLSPRKDIGIVQTGKARRKKQKDLEKQREMEKEFAVDVDPDETRDPSAFVSTLYTNRLPNSTAPVIFFSLSKSHFEIKAGKGILKVSGVQEVKCTIYIYH